MTRTLPANTEDVVRAIRRLVTFSVDQAGAYRELFGAVADQLGRGVPTRLITWLVAWASSPENGAVILTGNAGTGKTAAAEEFCSALGSRLPATDELVEVAGALVAKDVSGMPTRAERAAAFRRVLAEKDTRKALLCANEGVLRDASEDLADQYPILNEDLEKALREGASASLGLTIVNVNRQRLTSEPLWDALLNYLTRQELWQGCEGCPASGDAPIVSGCPMRANANALRRPDTRSALRLLLEAASGDAVPTMREVLSLIAYAICGDSSGDAGDLGMWTCEQARNRFRDRGANAFTASSAYYNLLFGSGLAAEIRERSPLLTALMRLGVGSTADLQVDDWLRDSGRADADIRSLAGSPGLGEGEGLLAGSRSPLDRVRTAEGEMTFHRLGELVSISEDEAKVRSGLKALVFADLPAQKMWRRRVLFEGASSLGGPGQAVARLTSFPHAPELIDLAHKVAAGHDVVTDVKRIIKGLNFLVTGFADASEGLIVPEPASLFARNPGSFRPARPAFVHAKIPAEQIRLEVPDEGLVAQLLDIDHVEVRLVVGTDPALVLTIGPRIYRAIREAELYRGPVGHGTAEMTDLRSFYGRVAHASHIPRESGMQIADPSRAALVRVQLPHFSGHA